MYSLETADRIRRPSNDSFFLNGDIFSNEGSLTTSLFFLQSPFDENNQSSEHDGDAITSKLEGEGLDEELSDTNVFYPCALANCPKRFSTLKECEIHYQQSHVYECLDCGRVLPSEHWLDLVST